MYHHLQSHCCEFQTRKSFLKSDNNVLTMVKWIIAGIVSPVYSLLHKRCIW
jgi:hypothetical protein